MHDIYACITRCAHKSFYILFVFFCTVLLFAACRKKTWDDYYARPQSLEAPVYQQLQERGNFKQLLSLIDKAGYKNTLSSAGYWTVFAPTDSAISNDAAFKAYLQEKKINSFEQIDSATAQSIIQYLLVYNSFIKERIDDYQSNAGWVPDDAFRRRTAYYTGFYKDTMLNGQAIVGIASNRNGSSFPYVPADNNNKYIPYFTDVYFAAKKLTASDYNYFYPTSIFNGFNVVNARVTEKDIAAENGVIHIIDKAITPLPSIDEYFKGKPEYSVFADLFKKYTVNYLQNADATRRFQILTGENAQVYVKVYNSSLAFSPNNENYAKVQDNDGQQNAWSIFVPKNDVLVTYLKNVLLEEYGKDTANLSRLPPQVIADFLNAHMWINAVWPSKFKTTLSFLGEEARFNPQTDVFDKKILSNGLFYGTNKVQEANVFSSVYARSYLNPKYTIMTRLLDAELKFLIISPNQKYTLFMMSDAVIKAAGYDYNPTLNEWSYTPPGGARTAGEAVRQRLLRILNTSLVQTPKSELNDLSGSGIAEANNGEFIKFNNNQLITAGTLDANKVVKVDSTKTAANGKVYYLNGLLTFSEINIGTHIKNLATSPTSDFYFFWKYLESSTIYNVTSGEIAGTSAGSFYTVFIPDSNAIKSAVKDGLLPGDKVTGAPVFNPALAADKELVSRFILYHILNKKSVIPDGKESGGFETLLKNAGGDVLPVTVISLPGSLQVTDMNNRKSNVIVPKSNNLSNRTVIHLVDNYFKYNY